MARPPKETPTRRTRPAPATTPSGREIQMISLAVDLAEKQLTEGTASAQVITHYLKLATQRDQLEREKLAYETELLKAKKADIEAQARIEDLYEQALHAMRSYSPHPSESRREEPEDEDYYSTEQAW